MSDEIINRVAQSALITFDLEDVYPKGERRVLDIKDWLFEGVILKEKEFRAYANEHDWTQYQNCYLSLTCSTDAILPGWAFILLASLAAPYAKKVVKGDLATLNTLLYQEALEPIDFSQFKDKPVIIKGCSNQPVPDNAYLMALAKLQPWAKSVMYGEACSSVPIFKKR